MSQCSYDIFEIWSKAPEVISAIANYFSLEGY